MLFWWIFFNMTLYLGPSLVLTTDISCTYCTVEAMWIVCCCDEAPLFCPVFFEGTIIVSRSLPFLPRIFFSLQPCPVPSCFDWWCRTAPFGSASGDPAGNSALAAFFMDWGCETAPFGLAWGDPPHWTDGWVGRDAPWFSGNWKFNSFFLDGLVATFGVFAYRFPMFGFLFTVTHSASGIPTVPTGMRGTKCIPSLTSWKNDSTSTWHLAWLPLQVV